VTAVIITPSSSRAVTPPPTPPASDPTTTSASVPVTARPPLAECTAPAAVTAAIQIGSLVRIYGLQTTPRLNGRTGIVCSAFNEQSGRWVVEVDAVGSSAACQAAVRPANLRIIHSHNFGTQWMDEEGSVWPKYVDFSHQCAKGHTLAPLSACVGASGTMRFVCRLCHSISERVDQECASWLICSVFAGCCGGYAVCCSCACASSSAADECAVSDNIQTLVSSCIEYFVTRAHI
jgi:hypothetical protein